MNPARRGRRRCGQGSQPIESLPALRCEHQSELSGWRRGDSIARPHPEAPTRSLRSSRVGRSGGLPYSAKAMLELAPARGLRGCRVGAEFFDAKVGKIANVDVPTAIRHHRERIIELTVDGAERAPLPQVLAGGT